MMFYKILISAYASLFFLSNITNAVDDSPLKSGFKEIREVFGLQTTGVTPRQYGIPDNLRTGITEEVFGKQLTPLPPMDLSNYDEVITNTGATIPQVLASFPPYKWKEMFPNVKEIIQFNQHVNNEEAFNDEDEKAKFKNWLEELTAIRFLMGMSTAYAFLPPAIAKECPAAFIMSCGFSEEDTNFEKAIKFLKLGLHLTDAPQLNRTKAFSLSAESFHQAAINFEAILPKNIDILNGGFDPIGIIDGYVSALQCHTWAAIRYPDIGSSRESIKDAKRVFVQGFNILRRLENNPGSTDELKERLAPYKAKYNQWTRNYMI